MFAMRKQILILGHNYATQFIDIYNQYTRLFDPNHYEVTVAFLSGEEDESVQKRMLAENVIFLKIPKRSLRYLKIRAIYKLIRLQRQRNFSLVICHRYKPSFIMMWVAKFCAIPACIFVMHELRTMHSKRRQFLIAALAKKNMLFAGVSNAVRDDMRRDLWCVPKDHIVTLYNMIDTDLTEPQFLERPEACQTLGLPEDAFIFGNVARLARNKDQASLIEAFAMIKPHCPLAKLIIIGDGTLEDELKEKAQTLGVEADIIFTGFVANGFKYMKAFDCFVLSSIQEAFGRVLIEAMLAKLPIIATSVNGIPEVVGNSGLLVNPKDPKILSYAMQQVYDLSLEKRASIAEQGYQHVKRNFSIESFHEIFWQLPFVRTLKYETK